MRNVTDSLPPHDRDHLGRGRTQNRASSHTIAAKGDATFIAKLTQISRNSILRPDALHRGEASMCPELVEGHALRQAPSLSSSKGAVLSSSKGAVLELVEGRRPELVEGLSGH